MGHDLTLFGTILIWGFLIECPATLAPAGPANFTVRVTASENNGYDPFFFLNGFQRLRFGAGR